jgi:hypothetical protein
MRSGFFIYCTTPRVRFPQPTERPDKRVHADAAEHPPITGHEFAGNIGFPGIPGGKKLIYTHITMPLVALDELRDKSAEDERYAGLADIVEANNGLWCPAAERYLLEHWAE